jgi:hypothetical protein
MFLTLITLFNNIILKFFKYIYKSYKIETLEDKFHNHKKDSKLMNETIFKFKNENEFNIVKNNILNIIGSEDFLMKYDITLESILNDTNNKVAVSFKDTSIYIYFNHYYISGPTMFILLNRIFNSSSPTFLKTNPFLGIINLPFYLYDMMLLKKKKYLKNNKQTEHLIVEKNIKTNDKRYYLYLNTLKNVYTSLQMNRPMVVALPVAFDELPYINNNVGIIIINYEITDTIETLKNKIINASYQAYCSNFIINCPLPSFGKFEIRNYIDCIISVMYIKTDYDFIMSWNCAKPPIEQMYVGSISLLHSDKTMDINMNFHTCSLNYVNNSS